MQQILQGTYFNAPNERKVTIQETTYFRTILHRNDTRKYGDVKNRPRKNTNTQAGKYWHDNPHSTQHNVPSEGMGQRVYNKSHKLNTTITAGNIHSKMYRKNQANMKQSGTLVSCVLDICMGTATMGNLQ